MDTGESISLDGLLGAAAEKFEQIYGNGDLDQSTIMTSW